jgi:hypothetical protein
MGTFSTFPTTITLGGFWYTQFNRHYQKTSNTSSFIQYELYSGSNLVGVDYGSTFTATSSGIVFNVDDTGDSSTPLSYSNGSTFVGTSGTVTTGDTITLWASSDGTGQAEAVFTVPDFGYSSSGGGGGTSTQGSSTPSGSYYFNSQNQIVFVISSSSPSSDGTIVYKIYRRPIGGTLQQAYVVPHTSGSTPTEWSIGVNYSLYDQWQLRVVSSTGLVESDTLAVYNVNKKVFCNFW